MTLSVDLPGVARVVSISGPGWPCTGLTCRHDASIAPGGASTVTLQVALVPDSPSDVVTMAQVSGGEINPGNDACLAFSYLR